MAGFTNITFKPTNVGLIDGARSYVSFSRYSDAVFLPQDPGRGKTMLLAIQRVLPSASTEGQVSAHLPWIPGGLERLVSPLRS